MVPGAQATHEYALLERLTSSPQLPMRSKPGGQSTLVAQVKAYARTAGDGGGETGTGGGSSGGEAGEAGEEGGTGGEGGGNMCGVKAHRTPFKHNVGA